MMDQKTLAEIKALTADAESELATLGTPLTAPAISVDVFNDISPKTAPKLRKLVSLANVYIPALIAEVERLTAENKKLHEISAQNYGDRYLEMQEENATLKTELQDSHQDHIDDFMRLKTEIATLKRALELACERNAEYAFCGATDDMRKKHAEKNFQSFIHQAQEQEGKK